MLKKFKSIMCLGILSVMVIFSACTNEKMTSKDTKTVNVSVPSLKVPNNGENYKATLVKNLKVDAKVNVCDVKELPIIQVTEKVFDKNKLLNMFLGSKDIKQKKEEDYFTANNKKLIINEKLDGFKLMMHRGECVTSIIDEQDNFNKFKLKELDFMTKSKAIKQAKDMFKTVNITPYVSPKIYALDYKTLQQEQDVLMKDEHFKFFVDRGDTKIKDKWTKDDECYYIVFRIDMNGIPCYDGQYVMQNEQCRVSGSRVNVVISKNGIEVFYIEKGIYNDKNSKKNDVHLISVEQALGSLKKKYSDITLTNEMTVTDISMIYLPVITSMSGVSDEGVPLNKKVEMVPCWYFKINEKCKDLQGKVYNVPTEVRINATNGKDIS